MRAAAPHPGQVEARRELPPDLTIRTIFEGTSEIQQLVIARASRRLRIE